MGRKDIVVLLQSPDMFPEDNLGILQSFGSKTFQSYS